MSLSLLLSTPFTITPRLCHPKPTMILPLFLEIYTSHIEYFCARTSDLDSVCFQVLHYFKKSEDNRNPYLSRGPYHGRGGFLTVQEAPWRTPLVLAFVQSGEELGYQNRDINGEIQAGFMVAQV